MLHTARATHLEIWTNSILSTQRIKRTFSKYWAKCAQRSSKVVCLHNSGERFLTFVQYSATSMHICNVIQHPQSQRIFTAANGIIDHLYTHTYVFFTIDIFLWIAVILTSHNFPQSLIPTCTHALMLRPIRYSAEIQLSTHTIKLYVSFPVNKPLSVTCN